MKQNLLNLKQIIDQNDKDIFTALKWLEDPNRSELFNDLLIHNILHTNKPTKAKEFVMYKEQMLDFLNERWHSKAWPLHDVHFHTSFEQYVYCPYTCLNEISECLEKILKEYFCA